MMSIKRGASFRVALKAESQEEWEALYPMDYAISQIRFGDVRYDLEVSIDNLSQCIYVKSDTLDWPIGEGAFDIKTISGDLIQTIPELTNISVIVEEGATL